MMMHQTFTTYFKSPIGVIKIRATENGITHLDFVERAGKGDTLLPACLKNCVMQLAEYFSGKRRDFKLSLETKGTDFQKKVWDKLAEIPYGETLSYGEIAARVKNHKASRAVGLANNKNQIAIVIPCHRVIGADGSLTGYAGGLWRKEWLLRHEGKFGGQ